jgi:hypothetical protein
VEVEVTPAVAGMLLADRFGAVWRSVGCCAAGREHGSTGDVQMRDERSADGSMTGGGDCSIAPLAKDYTTSMTGRKFKIAHKRADNKKWSVSSRAQRRRMIRFLRGVAEEHEA